MEARIKIESWAKIRLGLNGVRHIEGRRFRHCMTTLGKRIRLWNNPPLQSPRNKIRSTPMRTWNFSIGDSKHSVQVAHDPIFSGELEIYVDGKEVVNTTIPSGKNYAYPFKLEDKPCKVQIRFSGPTCTYEVLVEGKSQPYSGAQDLVSPK
jgi:hypothetical protein